MAWATPKTNWAASDGVSTTDMNRIEQNAIELKKAATIAIVDTGNLITATDVENALQEIATDVKTGRTSVASSITAMGQSAAGTDSMATLATKIRNISKDSTATAAQILNGYTAYVNGVKTTGTQPNKVGIAVDSVGRSADGAGNLWLNPQAGYYDNTSSVHLYDTSFVASNIAYGAVVLGITGTNSKRYGPGDIAPITASAGSGVKSFTSVGTYVYGITVSPANGDIMLVTYSSPNYYLNVVKSDLFTTSWYGTWGSNSYKHLPKYLNDGTFLSQNAFGRMVKASAAGSILATTASTWDLASNVLVQFYDVDQSGGYIYAALSNNSSVYKLRKYSLSDLSVVAEVALTVGTYACSYAPAQSAVFTCDGNTIKKYNASNLSLAWSLPVPANYVFYDLVYDPIGDKLFLWTYNNTTSRYVLEIRSATTGALVSSITPYAQSNWSLWFVDPYGHLWINDTNGVSRYKNDGTFVSYTAKTSGSYQSIYGITWNAFVKSVDCGCYTSSTGSDTFFRISPYSTIV